MFINAYYPIKRYMPRRVQLMVRRVFATAKRRLNRHVWPIDPDSATPPEQWNGWPGGKRFAFVLTHDVDTQRGHDRCLDLMKLEQASGFVSSFNLVAGEYVVLPELRRCLRDNGFEVGVHGLYHNAEMYESRVKFNRQAVRINRYLREWESVGFRSPCMYHNLEWLRGLDISYDASTFDTDPFEPQPDGMGTIFPFIVEGEEEGRGYVELPYTLPQDFTLFVLFREKNIDTWKRKLDWVVKKGGMVLLNTHPDYMNFRDERHTYEEYPARLYRDLLEHVKSSYGDSFWNPLPREVAAWYRERLHREDGSADREMIGMSGDHGIAGACA